MQQKGAVRKNVVLAGEAVLIMLSVFFFSLPLSVFYIESGLFVSFFILFILPISVKCQC